MSEINSLKKECEVKILKCGEEYELIRAKYGNLLNALIEIKNLESPHYGDGTAQRIASMVLK